MAAWKVGFLLVVCALACMAQVVIRAPPNCISDGDNCINHVECCSGTCLPFNSRCARNNDYYEPTSLDRSSLQTLVNGLFASTERPANYNVPPVTLNSRFGEVGGASTPPTQTEGIPIAVKPDCKVVGLKCFRDDECCTNRCHGFLHQCVT